MILVISFFGYWVDRFRFRKVGITFEVLHNFTSFIRNDEANTTTIYWKDSNSDVYLQWDSFTPI